MRRPAIAQAAAALAVAPVAAREEAPFRVVHREDRYEIRKCAPFVVAKAERGGPRDEAANCGACGGFG